MVYYCTGHSIEMPTGVYFGTHNIAHILISVLTLYKSKNKGQSRAKIHSVVSSGG